MSIQRQVVMTCDLCDNGGAFGELSDAQLAGWVSLIVRPAGASMESDGLRSWVVDPECWKDIAETMGVPDVCE